MIRLSLRSLILSAFLAVLPAASAQTPPPAAETAKPPAAPEAPKDSAKEVAKEAAPVEPGPLLQIKTPLMRSLTIGGSFRLRGEWRDPADYRIPGTFGRAATADADDDTNMFLQRTRIYLDADVIEQVRVFVELQDARQWGEEASTVADTADIDLKQGYVEFRKVLGEPLTVRAGRMEVPSLGDQRIVSALDWHNVGRSWDGMHATWTPANWVVHVLAANLKEANLTGGDAGDDHWFWGVYSSWRGLKDHEFDFYVLGRSLSDRTFASETGTSPGERYDVSPGFRAKGKVGGFDYGGEVVGQFGHQADDPVRAWAGAATAGYTFNVGWKPRVGVEYAFASGDENPTDGEVGTFDPLLPFGHFFHGHMDVVGWRNLHAASIQLRANPTGNLTVHLDGHTFQQVEARDAWYDAAGTRLRRDATGNSSRDIGQEIDLYAKWKLWDRVSFWTGFSHFFPGSLVSDTGFDPDMNWLFFQMEVKF